jgi:hypothetical protein
MAKRGSQWSSSSTSAQAKWTDQPTDRTRHAEAFISVIKEPSI